MADILRLLVDADTSGAVREFQKLGKGIDSSLQDVDKKATGIKGSIAKAFDGLQAHSATATSLFQKVGVSSEQAAGMIAAAIPAAGIAAGAALVTFAAKGIKAFQDTALAAGKFADSTGLSVDSASRYIAVADDIGVGASTIQGAFVKMEKAMATNRAAFGDLVATTKSGGVDLDQTFLNVISHIQGIKDPIERANESSKLFGRGFAEVSQIIGTNADTLKQKLADVSSAQVISDAELKKAREYQAAMDNLKDAVRDVSIQLGSALVPALSEAANGMAGFITSVQQVNQKSGGFLGDLVGAARDAIDPVQRVRDSWQQLQDSFGSNKTGEAATSFNVFGAALGAVKSTIEGITPAGAGLSGAMAAVSGAVTGVNTAVEQANKSLGDLANAQLAAFDSTFAVKNAQDQFATALMAAETAAASGTASAGQLTQAYDDETQAAVKVAQAVVTKAEKDAEAAGSALTAKQSNDLLISTLQAQAAQASGPTKTALNGLITDLQKVGAQNPKPTITVIDQATPPINAVQTKLDVIGRTKATAAIHADDNTAGPFANAFARGNAWAGRVFTATIQTITLGAGATGPVRQEGGPIPGSKGRAIPILAHGGEYVLSADVVDRIKKGQKSEGAAAAPALMMGGGTGRNTVVNITVNGAVDPYNTARQIQTILAKGTRGGFSTLAA